MSTYSVLLQSYRPIPHIELGHEIASLVDIHEQDAFMMLRRQQGIVREGLELDKAKKIAAFLIEKGWLAGLVADEHVVNLPKPEVVHNADVLKTGVEIEDLFGDDILIKPDRFELAQAGWILEKIKVGSRARGRMFRNNFGPVEGQWRYPHLVSGTRPVRETMGWVLHLFLKGDPVKWFRIISMNFIYDYQDLKIVNRSHRFGILLSDLARILPFEILDPAFKSCMGSGSEPDTEGRYEDLHSMTEHARWLLTMKRLQV